MQRVAAAFLSSTLIWMLCSCAQTAPAPMKESSPEPAPQPATRVGTPAPDAVPGVPSVSPETIALAEAVSSDSPPPSAVVIEPPAAPAATPPPSTDSPTPAPRVIAQEKPVALAGGVSGPVPLADTPVYPVPVAKPQPASRKGEAFPVASAEPVHINAFVIGDWRRTPSGYEWRLRLQSQGASSLGIVASPIRLPAASSITLQSPDGRERQGPFQVSALPQGQPFYSPAVRGAEVDLILQLPPGSDMTASAFVVQQVSVGYRN